MLLECHKIFVLKEHPLQSRTKDSLVKKNNQVYFLSWCNVLVQYFDKLWLELHEDNTSVLKNGNKSRSVFQHSPIWKAFQESVAFI